MRGVIVLVFAAQLMAVEPEAATRIRYQRTEPAPDEKGKVHLAVITGHGTAFGIDLTEYGLKEPRYLLTARHNLFNNKDEQYSILKLEISSGDLEIWAKPTVIAHDKDLDLCLIKVPVDVPMLKLSDSEAKVGSPIDLTGSPRGIPIEKFSGSVLSLYHRGSAFHVAAIKFDHGNSGAPLIQSGAVVGIATAGIPYKDDLDPTKCLYLPVAAIREFLRRGLSDGK